MSAESDEYVQIARQLGVFVRRAERFWASFRIEPNSPSLGRDAYLLLGEFASADPRRLSAVAADACLDLSTVSRQVAALEAAGLVNRTGDPTDHRAHLIGVTQAGDEVLADNREKWQAVLRELLAGWTSVERSDFARLFARLNDAMARREQEKKR
jgi:DNA-binding MarR family transcriptional regulator